MVWIDPNRNKRGNFELGVKLCNGQNLWGVEFPMDDLGAPARGASQDAQPRGWRNPQTTPPVLAPHLSAEGFPVTVTSLLNALACLLERKGLLTREELEAEMRRLSG